MVVVVVVMVMDGSNATQKNGLNKMNNSGSYYVSL